MLEVFTDAATAKVLVSDATSAATGFEMVCGQIPCGIGIIHLVQPDMIAVVQSGWSS